MSITASLLCFTYILGIILKAVGVPLLATVSWVAVLAWYPVLMMVLIAFTLILVVAAKGLLGK